jgi:hypothetical protein
LRPADQAAVTRHAMPSIANGRPMSWPQRDIRPDHSTPISIDKMVPDTAPTANSRPSALAQRRASSR